MKSSYFFLIAILASFAGYIPYVIVKNKTNRVNNIESDITNDKATKHRKPFDQKQRILDFKFTAKPDYTELRNMIFFYNIMIFSIFLIAALNGKFGQNFSIAIYVILLPNALISFLFFIMNNRKIEIKNGELLIFSHFGWKQKVDCFQIEKMEYRFHNNYVEIKEKGTYFPYNDYKLKMKNYKTEDIDMLLKFLHLIETHKAIKMENGFF